MIPAVRAKQLEDRAKVLRSMAAGMRLSGSPVDLVLNGNVFPLDLLTADDLEQDAARDERDAAKLRTIFH